MHPLTPHQVCNAEYRAAKRFVTHCPRCGAPTSVADEAYCANSDCTWNNDGGEQVRCPADHPKARPSSPAPVGLDQRGSTRNKLVWIELGLELDGARRVVA